MTLPAPAGDKAIGANVVSVRSLGVTVSHGPDGGSIAVGYSSQSLATIYNHSVVQLPSHGQSNEGK
jgi:hypothetical protein